MDAFLMHGWKDDRIFDDENEFYEDFPLFFDDLVKLRNSNRGRIVELTDTGSDACSPELDKKITKFTTKSARGNKLVDLEINKKPGIQLKTKSRAKAHRSNGEGHGYQNKSQGNLYFSLDEDDDSLDKTSLDKLAVSSITFNIADRDIKEYDEEDNFEDFEDVVDKETDETQTRKRFVDRAVDSECLSNSSRSSIRTNSSVSSATAANLRRQHLKARTQEIASSKAARNKKLTKSQESVDNKFSRTNKPTSGSRKLRNKENFGLKINSPQVGRKLDSTSRTIIKEKKIQSTKERSQIPRFVQRTSSLRGNICLVKKLSFEGSRLPVWQGRRKTAIITGNVGHLRSKTVEIEKTFNRETSKKSIADESAESYRVAFEREDFKERPEAKSANQVKETEGNVENEIAEVIEGNAKVQTSKAAAADLAGNHDVTNKNANDQSKSNLWSREYEAAYAMGQAVGLKIHRMATAAREERKREFRRCGFEDYGKKPREKAQEILDIGVSILENVINDRHENNH